MIVQDFSSVLEEMAPLAYQADYDNAGLLVGSPYSLVNKVLITLDVTPEVVQEAIDCNANLIIAHHPFIFHPLKKFNNDDDTEKCLSMAIKHDISIYASHTNMDSVMHGVNGKICSKIGLQNCKFLVPQNQEQPYGDGMIGKLPQAENTEKFLERIKNTFHCGTIRHTNLCKKDIQKVAVCGGAGSFLIHDAIAAGADIFISADIKYHDFFLAENKIIIADIGHYESEQFTKELFYELLIKKFYNFAIQISKVNTNPINYL